MALSHAGCLVDVDPSGRPAGQDPSSAAHGVGQVLLGPPATWLLCATGNDE